MRAGGIAMLQVAFAGTFSATLEPSVRARLDVPCAIILGDEAGIVSRLADVDVLVTLTFSPKLGAAAKRLKLVQVPGAGLDRIDRSALPAGASLANALRPRGRHRRVRRGSHARADTELLPDRLVAPAWSLGKPVGRRLEPARALARAGGKDA